MESCAPDLRPDGVRCYDATMLRWRDVDEAGWQGCEFTLTGDDVERSPQWCVDVVYPRRFRITAGGAARWWAWWGPWMSHVGLLRGDAMTRDDAVVRPITADDLRDVVDAPGTVGWWRVWSRWFIDAMVASRRSPLRPGRWWMTPVGCVGVPSLSFVHQILPGRAFRLGAATSSRYQRIRPNLSRADGDPWNADLFDESLGGTGSYALLPLRRASPPESGRVKAWRKRARDGTLPPVLVHYVEGLTMFVLLDGHDRYAAARAEGVPVPWLLVSALSSWTVTLDAATQAGVVRQVERMTPATPVGTINALYAAAFDDRPIPCLASRGRVLQGGVHRWDDEVTRRLSTLGLAEQGEGLFAELAPRETATP